MKNFCITAFLLVMILAVPLSTIAQCNQCLGDRDLTTNCIEVKFEVINSQVNSICYRAIIYNHQFSTNPTLCSQYNAERHLTFELVSPSCYDNINLQIFPVKTNTWDFTSGGTIYQQYNRITGHASKIIWNRRNIPPPPAPSMTRCAIDTFIVCLGCTASTDSACANGNFDIKIYFSDANGNPSCVDETNIPGLSRNYERISPRVPRCYFGGCGDCLFFESACNSWSVTFGCDYIDLTIVNDHSYPQCSNINHFEFFIGGMEPCSLETAPKFRDWSVSTARDTLNARTFYSYTSPNQGLRPCDSLKIRIPFCCTDGDSTIYFQPGPGFCDYYSTGTASGVPRLYHTFPALACPPCYLHKDRGELHQRNPMDYCDTMVICNLNTASPCGTSGTATNRKIRSIHLDPGTSCMGVVILPPHGGSVIPPVPPSTTWVINGASVEPCDCIKILLCGCSSLTKVRWTTFDNNGDTIQTDTSGGGWPEDPWSPGHKPQVPSLEPSTTGSNGAMLGEATPNPTTGIIDIPVIIGLLENVNGMAQIEVYTVNGNLIEQFDQKIRANTTTHLRIDGSGWNNGTYLVRVHLGETILTTTFILRK